MYMEYKGISNKYNIGRGNDKKKKILSLVSHDTTKLISKVNTNSGFYI